MPAITSIEIENFRCFKKLAVGGLTPVNLIVGANNAGKTALLEAIEAVVSEESPFLLYRASFERGEFRQRRGMDEHEVQIDLSHWFYGHVLDDGVTFRIRAAGERLRSVARTVQRVPPNSSPPLVAGRLQLTIERPEKPSRLPTLPLTEDDFLGAGAPSSFIKFGIRLRPPVGFVTTDRLFPSELAALWANVVLTPAEERTVQALRLVEPAIDRMAISENGGTASAKVLLRGAQGPVPLGTLGEGVSRILTLALNLAVTQGGFLFLDEIENGLHWSVMPKLWRFLVETARALDVQVFATTHSKDCLEGLADLYGAHPELAEHVSIHRLEAGRDTSVRFDAGRIAEYIQMELEAR
jgi:energy-coupling factor transporter ATP-binding protein EcfA2